MTWLPWANSNSKKRPRNVTSRVFPWISILMLSGRISTTGAQSTCTFNGVTFQSGDALGDAFQTRCGSVADYPCFCAPERNPPIDCPYCGIVTTTNDQNLVCARVGGPFIQVVNMQGVPEECACNRDSDGNPQSTCIPQGSSTENGNVPVSAPSPALGEVCLLEWADGAIDVYQDGESYGELFETECGSAAEFPCFCNISIPSKLYCPYCGVTMPAGDLTCGGIGQTFPAIDPNLQPLSCFCKDNLEPDCVLASSINTPAPVVPISVSPSLRPSLVPSPAPTISTVPPFFLPRPTLGPQTTMEPSSFPTIERIPTVASAGLDKPSILMPSRTSPSIVDVPGCTITDEQGNEVFVPAGEIVAVLDGPCSPSESFPILCNPNLPGQVEYPYCVFTLDGTWDSDRFGATGSAAERRKDPFLYCAQNEEQVLVPTTTDGEVAECSCIYLNPYIGAVSSCPEFLVVNVPLALTPASTSSPPVPSPNEEQTTPTTSDDTPDRNDSSSGAVLNVASARCTWMGLVGWFLLLR
jgi:hypothetical protein